MDEKDSKVESEFKEVPTREEFERLRQQVTACWEMIGDIIKQSSAEDREVDGLVQYYNLASIAINAHGIFAEVLVRYMADQAHVDADAMRVELTERAVAVAKECQGKAQGPLADGLAISNEFVVKLFEARLTAMKAKKEADRDG
jgi:hypothetical protein